MKSGFTKAWRKELKSAIWQMPPIYHRVWYWLRQKVEWEPYLFHTPRKIGIWALPGQRITSYQLIAEGVAWNEWGVEKIPNKKTIKMVVEWLESQGMIKVESNPQGTLITIMNWDIYNGSDVVESNAQETLTGLATDQPTDQPTGHREEFKRSPKKKPLKPLSPESLRLSGVLAELILKNNPNNRELNNGKGEATILRWADDIDKMVRIDNRTFPQVEKVIRWSQGDIFWSKNILSGDTLRKQYDKLILKIKDDPQQQVNPARLCPKCGGASKATGEIGLGNRECKTCSHKFQEVQNAYPRSTT